MKIHKLSETKIWTFILVIILLAHILLYNLFDIDKFQKKAVIIDNEMTYHQDFNDHLVKINNLRDSVFLPYVNKHYLSALYNQETVEFMQKLGEPEKKEISMHKFYRSLIQVNLEMDELLDQEEELKSSVEEIQEEVLEYYRLIIKNKKNRITKRK